MTVCQHCGRTFRPRTGAGRKARYCSAACKQAAYRKRHTERRTALDLSREEFDAMQDGSLIDQLRFVRDVLGRPDLVDDERYATNIARVARRAEVDELIGSLTREYDSVELAGRLDEFGVPAARLNDVSGLVDHPQLAARDRWRDVETPAGPVRGLLPPMTFTDVELPMRPVPALGQHTDAILAELGVNERGEDTSHGTARE